MHQLFIIWLSTIAPAQADRFIGDNTLGQVKFDVGSTLHNVPGDITRFTTELNLGELIDDHFRIRGSSEDAPPAGAEDSARCAAAAVGLKSFPFFEAFATSWPSIPQGFQLDRT